MNKTELFQEIRKCERKSLEWGQKASEWCKKYIEKYAEFKVGNRVKVIDRWDVETFGMVVMVRFYTGEGFSYNIRPHKKDFSRPHYRRNNITVRLKGHYNNYKSIEVIAKTKGDK